jgi:AcrR family transcriptional regulator
MTEETNPRGEQTREAILQAAYQLFLDNGYHATSMRQISQVAGIALGGIYNHFTSKEDIFLAVVMVQHPLVKILPVLENSQGASLEAFFQDAAQRAMKALGSRADLINLMFIELVEFEGKHLPELFEQIFPKVLAFIQRFPEDRGELRDIPMFVLVRFFFGTIFSHFLIEQLIADRFPQDYRQDTLSAYIDLFLHGILADPTGKGKPEQAGGQD